MQEPSIIPALAGGALIGLAASIALLVSGKVAGISGVVAGVLRSDTPDRAWRLRFLAGLLAGAVGVALTSPAAFGPATRPLGVIAIAGLLVGFGTRLGSGCTSGHGVCGMSRLSKRSFVATLTFMASAAVTVLVTSGWFGGGP